MLLNGEFLLLFLRFVLFLTSFSLQNIRSRESAASDHHLLLKNLDDNIGKLFAALDSLEGLSEKTLVIFSSDNMINNSKSDDNDNDNDGKRRGMGMGMDQKKKKNKKNQLYETNLRVPTIFRWKGVIEPEMEQVKEQRGPISLSPSISSISSVDRFLVHTDLFPTLMELIGHPLPASVRLDGLSFLPLLLLNDKQRGKSDRKSDSRVIVPKGDERLIFWHSSNKCSFSSSSLSSSPSADSVTAGMGFGFKLIWTDSLENEKQKTRITTITDGEKSNNKMKKKMEEQEQEQGKEKERKWQLFDLRTDPDESVDLFPALKSFGEDPSYQALLLQQTLTQNGSQIDFLTINNREGESFSSYPLSFKVKLLWFIRHLQLEMIFFRYRGSADSSFLRMMSNKKDSSCPSSSSPPLLRPTVPNPNPNPNPYTAPLVFPWLSVESLPVFCGSLRNNEISFSHRCHCSLNNNDNNNNDDNDKRGMTTKTRSCSSFWLVSSSDYLHNPASHHWISSDSSFFFGLTHFAPVKGSLLNHLKDILKWIAFKDDIYSSKSDGASSSSISSKSDNRQKPSTDSELDLFWSFPVSYYDSTTRSSSRMIDLSQFSCDYYYDEEDRRRNTQTKGEKEKEMERRPLSELFQIEEERANLLNREEDFSFVPNRRANDGYSFGDFIAVRETTSPRRIGGERLKEEEKEFSSFSNHWQRHCHQRIFFSPSISSSSSSSSSNPSNGFYHFLPSSCGPDRPLLTLFFPTTTTTSITPSTTNSLPLSLCPESFQKWMHPEPSRNILDDNSLIFLLHFYMLSIEEKAPSVLSRGGVLALDPLFSDFLGLDRLSFDWASGLIESFSSFSWFERLFFLRRMLLPACSSSSSSHSSQSSHSSYDLLFLPVKLASSPSSWSGLLLSNLREFISSRGKKDVLAVWYDSSSSSHNKENNEKTMRGVSDVLLSFLFLFSSSNQNQSSLHLLLNDKNYFQSELISVSRKFHQNVQYRWVSVGKGGRTSALLSSSSSSSSLLSLSPTKPSLESLRMLLFFHRFLSSSSSSEREDQQSLEGLVSSIERDISASENSGIGANKNNKNSRNNINNNVVTQLRWDLMKRILQMSKTEFQEKKRTLKKMSGNRKASEKNEKNGKSGK
jgi:hypothetical protein